jgi:uncharacterized protein (DUF2235 family)
MFYTVEGAFIQPCFRDTVASVGVVMGRSLPFTDSNKAIKTFRHALALDEVSLTIACLCFSSV